MYRWDSVREITLIAEFIDIIPSAPSTKPVPPRIGPNPANRKTGIGAPNNSDRIARPSIMFDNTVPNVRPCESKNVNTPVSRLNWPHWT